MKLGEHKWTQTWKYEKLSSKFQLAHTKRLDKTVKTYKQRFTCTVAYAKQHSHDYITSNSHKRDSSYALNFSTIDRKVQTKHLNSKTFKESNLINKLCQQKTWQKSVPWNYAINRHILADSCLYHNIVQMLFILKIV